MYKIKSIISILLLAIVFLIAWTTITIIFSDDNEDLGGGYTYYSEQKMISGRFQIPPIILEYRYNSEIIIVKQQPTKYKDIMYVDYDYPLGRDTIYYWIIEKKTNSFVGPINYDKFLKEVGKYDDKQITDQAGL
ncbi:MAG: hypothetical protein IJQ13_08610 [Prevotella sp.]|nr:hypothetical protein [Prevotella sp.]